MERLDHLVNPDQMDKLVQQDKLELQALLVLKDPQETGDRMALQARLELRGLLVPRDRTVSREMPDP
jgi:hypothetical protein